MISRISVFLAVILLSFGAHGKSVSFSTDHVSSLVEWWTPLDCIVDPNTIVKSVICLKYSNVDLLETLFVQVSDPNDPLYGNHVGNYEMRKTIAPSKQDVKKVVSWVSSFGMSIVGMTNFFEYITIEGTVEQYNQMLDTQFSWFGSEFGGDAVLRSFEFSVPEDIYDSLDFISGINTFPSLKTKSLQTMTFNNNEEDSGDTSPDLIKTWYNITDIGAAPNNTMAVAQFLEQYYSEDDLQKFFKDNDLPRHPVDHVLGPNNEKNPGMEASLDIEFIMGVAVGIDTTFLFNAGHDNNGQEPFLPFLMNMTNAAQLPLVMSVSYGDVAATLPLEYKKRCDVEFQILGVEGVTFLVASGDSGVSCVKACDKFAPDWPTSSPYVLSVGGTTIEDDIEKGVSFGGGGFSDDYPVQAWQEDMVSYYLNNSPDLPDGKFYNSKGRAYPDVSSFATNYPVVINGNTVAVGGTSASTPTWAAVVALLNDQRLLKGSSSFGFITPWIYQKFASNPECFHDLTEGSNPGACCNAGFTAYKKWDPITGVGSPNYNCLKKLI